MEETTLPDGRHCSQPKYEIYNAKERPDLWDAMGDPYHPLNTAWPVFLDQDATYQTYYPTLIEHDELARYQFIITETTRRPNICRGVRAVRSLLLARDPPGREESEEQA
jgi:hypothetical protein